jgi:hypothetical protein
VVLARREGCTAAVVPLGPAALVKTQAPISVRDGEGEQGSGDVELISPSMWVERGFGRIRNAAGEHRTEAVLMLLEPLSQGAMRRFQKFERGSVPTRETK